MAEMIDKSDRKSIIADAVETKAMRSRVEVYKQ